MLVTACLTKGATAYSGGSSSFSSSSSRSSSSSSKPHNFSQQPRLTASKEQADRSCAPNLQSDTVKLPPWISRHTSPSSERVSKKVEWFEFHMMELGFSPLDIRDVALTIEQQSVGDATLLAGMVEFLQLLLQLEDDIFVTKEVLMASAIHYAECITALHTGVYAIVREAIYRDGVASSNLNWLLSDSNHHRSTASAVAKMKQVDDPVTEYFDDTMELTKSNSAIVLVENTPKEGETTSSSDANDDNDEVARIALGAARIKRAEITARAVLGNDRAWSKDEATRLRGLLLSVMDDWRSLGIRAVACLYRLDGILKHGSSDGQGYVIRTPEVLRSAKEALRVYAPLAQRLGMQRLKARIEDAAFRVLYRRQYRAASALYRQSGPAMQTMSRYLENQIATLLLDNEQLMSQIANIQVTSRVKEPYSAWKKLVKKRFVTGKALGNTSPEAGAMMLLKKQKPDLSFIDLKDGVALRVIIEARKYHGEPDETTQAREKLLCYYVQHLIRTHWPGTDPIKDYIQYPKENGYQSLHYNSNYIASPDGKEWPFEVQVRSEEMHRIAEFGVAAHWDYKLGSQYVSTTPPVKTQLPSLTAERQQQLVKVQQELLEGNALTVDDMEVPTVFVPPPAEKSYIDALVTAKDQLVQNKVFVFFTSAKTIENDGKILSLPVGATVGQVLEDVQEATITDDRNVQILRNGREAGVEDLVGNGDVLLINWTK